MQHIKVYCPAKINLTLDILGIRENGYHDVKMIMQAVSLYDSLEISINDSEQILLKCSLHYIPNNNKNSAYKAAEAFFKVTGIKNKGLQIHIYKKIPVSAGLAGGSTDAAGVLLALNKLYGAPLSSEQIGALGLSIGADVPFCLMGGTALAEGLGEILTPLNTLSDCFIVLAKPKFGVSTKMAYKKVDEKPIINHPDTVGMLHYLKEENLHEVAHRLFNVMEDASLSLCSDIATIKQTILSSSPLACVMSGSGPTVFGIFEDELQAKECEKACKALVRDVFIVKPIASGITLEV